MSLLFLLSVNKHTQTGKAALKLFWNKRHTVQCPHFCHYQSKKQSFFPPDEFILWLLFLTVFKQNGWWCQLDFSSPHPQSKCLVLRCLWLMEHQKPISAQCDTFLRIWVCQGHINIINEQEADWRDRVTERGWGSKQESSIYFCQ